MCISSNVYVKVGEPERTLQQRMLISEQKLAVKNKNKINGIPVRTSTVKTRIKSFGRK